MGNQKTISELQVTYISTVHAPFRCRKIRRLYMCNVIDTWSGGLDGLMDDPVSGCMSFVFAPLGCGDYFVYFLCSYSPTQCKVVIQ